ncbi:MAG: hypothetical protein AAF969_13680 [Bacteroidota bacterium]
MKIVSLKILIVLISFGLLACNNQVNNEDSASADNMVVLKSNNTELTAKEEYERMSKGRFSSWKSIMDDDREL